MKEYLEQPYVEDTAEKFALDSFRAHTTDEATKEHGTTHCVIPGGCTAATGRIG